MYARFWRSALMFLSLAVLLSLVTARADAPPYINLQLILEDEFHDPVPDGLYNVLVRIWNDSLSNDPDDLIYAESHVDVEAENGGQATILVGSGVTTDVFDHVVFEDTLRWLGIKVGTDSEMRPRYHLVSVPFTFRTATVDGAKGGEIDGDVSILGEMASTSVITAAFKMSTGANTDFVLTSDFEGNGAWTDPALVDNGSWRLTGNAGTTVSHYLGTNDAMSLNFRVDNELAYRIEPAGGYTPNIIGGIEQNTATGGIHGVTISGGGEFDGYNNYGNRAYDSFGTVGGGKNNIVGSDDGDFEDKCATIGGGEYNRAGAKHAAVAGGYFNRATAEGATVSGGSTNVAGLQQCAVGGGYTNTASGVEFGRSVVAGGQSNEATGDFSAIGGGYNNEASAESSTIPGGAFNLASGLLSFAAGKEAYASHSNTFVWSDGTSSTPFQSTDKYQFLIQASAGVGINTNNPGPYALAVEGTVAARELVVTQIDFFPDYVFADEYELMRLDELERRIRAEKHLPGIPSAADIAENGMDIGEMQQRMMEKIEELTLYVIEISKENQELRKRLELLEDRKQEANQGLLSQDHRIKTPDRSFEMMEESK